MRSTNCFYPCASFRTIKTILTIFPRIFFPLSIFRTMRNWICLFVCWYCYRCLFLCLYFVLLIIKFCNQGLPLMACVIVLLKRWVLVKLRHTKKRLMTTRCTCTSYKILSNDFLRTMTELSTAHSLNFCSCQGMPSQTNLFCQRLSQLSSDN